MCGYRSVKASVEVVAGAAGQPRARTKASRARPMLGALASDRAGQGGGLRG